MRSSNRWGHMRINQLRRREFITLLGGAAAWPLAARAQQSAMPVIGFLRSTAAAGSAHLVTAFRDGLTEAGFVEGRNVAIEYRWADDHIDRLPPLAADLVRRQVAVIVANGVSAQAAKAATATIPVIAVTGSDPVRTGLVASLNRPGGNITGVIFTITDLAAKQLGLLHELVPKSAIVGVLVDPSSAESEARLSGTEEAGRVNGLQVLIARAASEREFNAAFAAMVQGGASALTPIAAPASTPPGFSEGRIPATCRCSCRPNSTWLSISVLRRRSTSTCRIGYLPSPTR